MVGYSYDLETAYGLLGGMLEPTRTADASEAVSRTTVSGKDAWYPVHKRDRFVLRQLVSKDFKLKYRRSALGVAWSVLNPLMMMIIMAAVFTRLMGRADDSIPNFPLYIIIGNTAFNLMSDATSRGLTSIIDASSLLKKVKINRWVFPVQKVLFSVVNYVFSLVAVILVMIFFRYEPSIYILYLIPGVFMLSVFCVGLSLLLSCAAVFFRDIIHLWSVFLTAWIYLTPMFYSIMILPEWLQELERFNPMYLYLTYLRDALLMRQAPSLELTLGCAGFAAGMLVVGLFVFRRHESKFILYI